MIDLRSAMWISVHSHDTKRRSFLQTAFMSGRSSEQREQDRRKNNFPKSAMNAPEG